MPIVTDIKPITTAKRVGRIMVRRWFRFHTAHVLSVRITDSCRSIQLGTRERNLSLLSDAAYIRPPSTGRRIKSFLYHVQMKECEPPLLKDKVLQALLVKLLPVESST